MYRWVDHTAEVELRIDSPTQAGVFEEAVDALAELGADELAGPPVEVDVAAEAHDRAGLLAAWLEELVFLAESQGFVAERVKTLTLGESGLSATVEGRRGTVRHLVKAVTYHGLSLERSNGTWHARVVLDV